jgi:biotin transporter BioY
MEEIYLQSMEASQNKSGLTIHFLVGGLVIHFAGILHLSYSVQKLLKNFLVVQWLFFSILGGKYDR